MNTAKKNLIKSLKFHAKDHHPTLRPHSFYKGKYAVNLFYVDDHADLLLTVRALVHLSMRVLDPEFVVDDFNEKNEMDYIRQALSIANRLMPYGEEAFLDQLNTYFREEGLREGLDRRQE